MNIELDETIVDLLLELYCAWRTECAAVQAAYDWFSTSAPSERALAFAAYEAALDREESAAGLYEDQVTLVSLKLAGGADGADRSGSGSTAARASIGSAWPWRW